MVLLPAFPGTVILSWPFSRLVSFSYFTGDGIVSTSTLSLAGTLTIVLVGSFVRTGFPTLGVISPVVGFTLYVVVIVSSPSSPLTVIASVPFSFVSSFS